MPGGRVSEQLKLESRDRRPDLSELVVPLINNSIPVKGI